MRNFLTNGGNTWKEIGSRIDFGMQITRFLAVEKEEMIQGSAMQANMGMAALKTTSSRFLPYPAVRSKYSKHLGRSVGLGLATDVEGFRLTNLENLAHLPAMTVSAELPSYWL